MNTTPHVILAAAALFFPSVSFAQGVPAAVKGTVSGAYEISAMRAEEHARAVKLHNEWVEATNLKARIDMVLSPPSENKEDVADLNKAVASVVEVQKPAALIRPQTKMAMPPTVGSFGFCGAPIKVLQVLDNTTFLGSSTFGTNERYTCLFRGWDVSNIVDGQSVRWVGVMWATNAETYRTALGGTKKVAVFQPVDAEAQIKEALDN